MKPSFVRNLLKKRGVTINLPASNGCIADFETYLGVNLPSYFKEIFTSFDGFDGIDPNSVICVWPLNKMKTFRNTGIKLDDKYQIIFADIIIESDFFIWDFKEEKCPISSFYEKTHIASSAEEFFEYIVNSKFDFRGLKKHV